MEYNTNGSRIDSEYFKEAVPILESPYTDEELYKIAHKKVRARNALIIHATAYVAVNLFLMFVAFSNGEFWNFYALGGWGIGLACHFASYFFSATPDAVHAEYLRQRNKYYK